MLVPESKVALAVKVFAPAKVCVPVVTAPEAEAEAEGITALAPVEELTVGPAVVPAVQVRLVSTFASAAFQLVELPPVAVITPSTSNAVAGVVVPIPTLPVALITARVVSLVEKIKGWLVFVAITLCPELFT